jgi:lipoic acid synthetase
MMTDGPRELQKPPWLKVTSASGPRFESVRQVLARNGVRTVCDSSHCPNISDCWSSGDATFMILGDVCTRSCRFCAVRQGVPGRQLDGSEAERVGQAVRQLELRHVVVTSVTRDDLPDGGAEAFSRTVGAIRKASPATTVELLIPDMEGETRSLGTVIRSGPDVLGHNLEVVRRLQSSVRDPAASYQRSLGVLRAIKEIDPAMRTKTSLMLGLGETEEEVLGTLRDVRDVGVDVLTLGQYLRPKGCQLAVERYVPPPEFEFLRERALGMGFGHVMAGPLVRSSYHAHEAVHLRAEENGC